MQRPLNNAIFDRSQPRRKAIDWSGDCRHPEREVLPADREPLAWAGADRVDDAGLITAAIGRLQPPSTGAVFTVNEFGGNPPIARRESSCASKRDGSST